MEVFSQEFVERTYQVIRQHFEENGRGITGPDLSERLFGTKKWIAVLSLLVEIQLSDRVVATQGPGGGYIPKGIDRPKLKSSNQEVSDQLKQDVSDMIETHIKHLSPNKGTNDKSVFLALVCKNYTQPAVSAAINILIAEGKFERVPGVGIKFPKIEVCS